jgi:hypothetical protein
MRDTDKAINEITMEKDVATRKYMFILRGL